MSAKNGLNSSFSRRPYLADCLFMRIKDFIDLNGPFVITDITSVIELLYRFQTRR